MFNTLTYREWKVNIYIFFKLQAEGLDNVHVIYDFKNN